MLVNSLTYAEINPATKPQATIIWLHGLGADGHDFVDIAPQLNLSNVRFVFPHASVRPISLNGGYPMRGWYDIYDLTDRGQEDAIGIRESAGQIQQLIQAEIERGMAAEKILLAGFSQGCAMALYCALRYPQKLAGVVALSGYLPLANTLAAEASIANRALSIFMAHGRRDEIVDVRFAERSRIELEKLHYAVDFRYYSMGHSVCIEEIRDVSQYLQSFLTN